MAKASIDQSLFFDKAYISVHPTDHSIQLFLGQHPINGSMSIEGGAAAVVSQSETGEVIFLLYPYESARRRMRKPYVIWHLTSDVMTIKSRILTKFVEDFLIYVRVSSALFCESASDRRRVSHLEQRSRVYEGHMTGFPGSVAGKLLAAASAFVAVLLALWLSGPRLRAGMSPLSDWPDS